jgi:hypothetical protein
MLSVSQVDKGDKYICLKAEYLNFNRFSPRVFRGLEFDIIA